MSGVPLDEAEILRRLADPAAHDERVRRRAADDAALTVDERLAIFREMARQAFAFLDALPPEVRARAEAYREPFDEIARRGLRRMAGIEDP
jgi:hypothetical protein